MTNRPENVVLPPGQQLAAPGKWPFVGERSPAESAEPWSVEICGLVDRPLRLSLDDLARLTQVERAVDIHCVTRWSKLGMRFGGVTLQSLLDLAGCQPAARFVSFVARSPREHSTSLALEDALRLGTLVVLTADGQPLLERARRAGPHGGSRPLFLQEPEVAQAHRTVGRGPPRLLGSGRRLSQPRRPLEGAAVHRLLDHAATSR